ncbi:PREDICTED: spermatid nuclear transition protein 1 [Dipodomys ordii]|uniref:Spermatid nuclear transition protein 1 n=1 Tax=Dipodomys ordii TaxID=10020 RepID=A0A1S3FA01_DIPOR|nr:PREDICTED: spermatid nuclear transition protein 1 [Dipodomys ordii]
MSTSCKSKSHGTRRAKNRSPHKGVKRSSNKKKCRKVSLKCRKHGDDEESSVNLTGTLGLDISRRKSNDLDFTMLSSPRRVFGTSELFHKHVELIDRIDGYEASDKGLLEAPIRRRRRRKKKYCCQEDL